MTQKSRKRLGRILIIALVALVVFYRWYLSENSMKIIEAYEVNPGQEFVPVLIATQGSEYKNALVSNFIDHYKDDSLYFKIIDVTDLELVQSANWRAILILYTWEKWKPQENAAHFISKNLDSQKMIVVSTSGSGEESIKNVDAITGASVLADIPAHLGELIQRMDKLLN